MNKFKLEAGDKVDVLLLNIEGVEKAKTFLKGELDAVTSGGIDGSVLAPFGLKYIPHQVIVDKEGKVICNYEGFDFGKVPM